MRIGIFFGGSSREREVSFSGGRTVFDNLDKSIFTPVPVFVDSLNQFILLDWEYIYKGTIRDFYPPVSYLPESPNHFQVYLESLLDLIENKQIDIEQLSNSVGKRINPNEFEKYFDFAFLALHGAYGEDGSIQGLLDWYKIPYSGSNITASGFGMDKALQKKLIANAGFESPNFRVFNKSELQNSNLETLFNELKTQLGFPFVIKPANQGSSIGVSIIDSDDLNIFSQKIDKAFFKIKWLKSVWDKMSQSQKNDYLRELCDIREGIGMPVIVNEFTFYHPEKLLDFLNTCSQEFLYFETPDGESSIIFESFIKGKEFSCIVVQDLDGKPIALPPTEIIKGKTFFDYKSKYLPGLSRKITPINLDEIEINKIRKSVEQLFNLFNFNVYARIDGFYSEDGKIFLNDPNTTSGMMPSSFFFHQAAEIGLNPSRFISYIIYTSLAQKLKVNPQFFHYKKALELLEKSIDRSKRDIKDKKRIAVILGGYSSERHISVESGRNIYEKLSSSAIYEAVPVFLTGDDNSHSLFKIPINILLKDNADDIKEKVLTFKVHPILKEIAELALPITLKFNTDKEVLNSPVQISYEDLAKEFDAVFIALHGRPGEDGVLQRNLIKYNIPFNGSGPESSEITINKYRTTEILRQNGFLVADAKMIFKSNWLSNKNSIISEIETNFKYPIIAKPSDDGCSSAVKKINNNEQLIAFAELMFRNSEQRDSELEKILNLDSNEEFPQKEYFMVESFIQSNGAAHFLEITGGMLTQMDAQGNRVYEIFEPSEALANNGILSLAEKFLAGEGQNITPARFDKNPQLSAQISSLVKIELEKAAKVLNIEGYCRIDAFVRIFSPSKIEVIFIEVNSLPGMTPATCIFHQAAINGYKPLDFIDKILNYGFLRTQNLVHNNEKLSN